jgi:predicted CXXCH cytochrome family protein
MSRLPFVVAVAVCIATTYVRSGEASTGHLDPAIMAGRCTPCHSSHGKAHTPMLREAGDEFCIACHSTRSADPQRKRSLGMSISARPADIESELRKQYPHRWATCADCHSVHGVQSVRKGLVEPVTMGQVKASTKRGFDTEADLCLSCHGSRGVGGGDPHDLRVRLDPRNPSYHPVLATGPARNVPSLRSPLSIDSRINCTDCHTNDDPSGPRGPHGSRVDGALGATMNRQEGQPESESTYALCYACHDRQIVLERDAFPYHKAHVVDSRVPCGFCHEPHGATSAPALIRFNESTVLTGVTASSSGLLGYESLGLGSGACYLTCHGVDHDPLGYGGGFDGKGRPMVPQLSGRESLSTGPRRVPNPRVAPAPRKPDEPK